MQIQEILIVKNTYENYGILTEDISQISRVPSLMPLPLRPSGTRGLCSVAGNVVTMVDMNLLLGMPEVELENTKSKIISLNNELSSNTLLVSDVYNTLEIDDENIEYLENADDPVIALYKYNDLLVQILSLEKLFLKIECISIMGKEIQNGHVRDNRGKEEESSRFLVFVMGNERYALEVTYLQEIILADMNYTEIAGSTSDVLGLITLREEIILVIDLRIYYGFQAKKSDTNRILIISYNNRKIGLCIDSIKDIKNIYTKDIEYMVGNFEDSKIAGVIHDTNSLISFFDHNVLNTLFKENDAFVDMKDNTIEDDNNDIYAMEVIVFKLANKEYAFNVDNVNEIIDVVSATNVAFSDKSIDGIINIRGQIVTTISLFEKLNIPCNVHENSKIIICNINDNRIGFVVDSVSDILNVKEEEIREESDAEGYFTSVLHLDLGERLVFSMDIAKIISTQKENKDG